MVQTLLIVILHIILVLLVSITNGFTLKMIPIDSPHLQIVPQHFTALEKHNFLANVSLSRVNHYTKWSSRLGPNNIKLPLFLAEYGYYVTILAFGTYEGFIHSILLLDTGFSETWVQCEGCDPCIKLNGGQNFSYTASRSFTRMGPNDPLCYKKETYEGSCRYSISFGHGETIGFIGRDTFFFEDAKTGQTYAYPGLAFGCGLQNRDFKFGGNTGLNGRIAGIHGLAPRARSFLAQLDSVIKGRFSYCLPPLSTGGPISYMYFGDDAQIRGDDTRIVQTISMRNRDLYHLYVNGISVDGTRLAIDPSIFELDPTTNSKGFFIDSGSPYTSLTKSAFDPLNDAVTRYFAEKYGWHPTTHEVEFKLCYTNVPSYDHIFPIVVFHFQLIGHGEVDWVMDKNSMFQLLDNQQGFCMTILTVDDPGPSIFGAFQQVDFNILYDAANGLLSFVPQRCLDATL